MTRHGKNCTAGAVYTYHEKKKDTAASGYGTQSVRLGKDAIKDFDCCCLSLQPCQDPVVTQNGYLYEKQAILEYILHQKTEIAKKMKVSPTHLSQIYTNTPYALSKDGETGGSQGSSGESSTAASAASSSQSLPSFWIPSLTPEAKPTLLKKPSKTVLCPMSGQPIKMNDLIPVRFTPLDASLDRVALLNRQERYVCAVTRDALGNSVPSAVLKPSGAVVTQECVEKLIKNDMVDPITGDKLSDRDIIPLQRGGTGFAASGVELKAKEARPVMQA
uniref:Nitric oxide synthase-interacting protein n=1 Tax=Kryptolebias marmoratus TaxID=37003 RepID=A0A3Q3BDM5_KRYMA